MKEERLGILGGMGPQATQIFYQRIIDRTEAATDQAHVPTLIWSDTEIPDRTAYILGGREEEVFQRLLGDVHLLERAGCTRIAIPCNTSHYFVPALQEAIGIPIIHMIEETAKSLLALKPEKVGILATDGTIQMGLYHKACEKLGLKTYTPEPEIQALVMSIIYDEIKRGEPGSREKFAQIDKALHEAGCSCAILGCTELSVFRNHYNLPAFYVDAMEVLAQCAILGCGRKLRNI